MTTSYAPDGIRFSACPVCASAIRNVYRLAHVHVVACVAPDCGLTFAGAQPDDNRLAELYASLYYPDAGDACPDKPNSGIDKFHQHLNTLNGLVTVRGKSVLDYGCGVGNFLKAAAQCGVSRAVGVEPNKTAREQGRADGLTIVPALSEFEDGMFDCIYSNDVLEHLRDPLGTLRDLWRVLAPGGTIFVTTINFAGMKSRLLRAHWDMVLDPTHFFYYTEKSLERLLREAGFDAVERLRVPTDFEHHGPVRRALHGLLVATGLDSGLQVVARKP